MEVRQSPGAALRRLAFLQDGVLTREQALAHDLSRRALDRLVKDGHWCRLSPGLFFTAGLEPGWRSWAWAGVLAGGDLARIGGLSACYLHGLSELAPMPITVLVPHESRHRRTGPWVFRRDRSLESTRFQENPPRSPVEVAVLDVCAEASADEVVGWVTASVQRRRTTPKRLRQALQQRARQPHRGLILGLLTEVALGVESPLERHYLRDVERAHGLPDGRRQASSRDLRSDRDVHYDEQLLIVELDGRLGHEGLGRFKDMWRDNVAVVDGWPTLRYGTQDVYQRPCEVARQVAQVLSSRGWTDLPRRCANCRRVV